MDLSSRKTDDAGDCHDQLAPVRGHWKVAHHDRNILISLWYSTLLYVCTVLQNKYFSMNNNSIFYNYPRSR